MSLKVVKFKISHGGYSAGEVAGFTEKVADRLITRGVAEAYAKAAPRHRAELEVEDEKPKASPKPKTARNKQARTEETPNYENK